MKLLRTISVLLLALALTACGGGGGNPGLNPLSPSIPDTTTTVPPITTTQTITPASIELLASANEVLSAGTEVLITAVVKNVNNVGMAAQPVVFAVTGGATLRGVDAKTNEDGVATARLSAGANKTLRNLAVSVTSGSSTGTITLPVAGTRVTLTGPTSLKFGEATTYVARLLDSSGTGIGGQAINLASALGNALTSTTLTTSPSGDISFTYTANVAGTDTLAVSALGASTHVTVAISDSDFIALSPAAGTQVVVNNSQTISVRYRVGGVGQSGQIVQFSTTRGLLSASSATTNADGVASTTISSSSSGPATVVAQIKGVGQVTLPLQFIATTPASLVLQANPGAVLPNNGGTVNQSTLGAVVLDATGNAVANRQVNFTIDEDDGNGGSLNSPTALTDANGRAQVQFISGSESTRTNGVKLRATVAGTTVAGTAAITVNGQALFISMGFGNTIGNKDDTTYSKAFSVYVTDANGNAVPSQVVTLSTIPLFYGRGRLDWSGTVWTSDSSRAPNARYTGCPNEDLNENGTLDPGEDVNMNGQLTPGNPVVVVPGTVTTDGQGRAVFALEYAESLVPWLTVNLVARATVGGTESRSVLVHPLTGLAADFNVETVAPAGSSSPFGLTQSCTSP